MKSPSLIAHFRALLDERIAEERAKAVLEMLVRTDVRVQGANDVAVAKKGRR